MKLSHAILLLATMGVVLSVELQYVESYRDAILHYRKHPNYMMSLLVMTTATDCAQCDQAMQVYEEFMYLMDGAIKTYVLDCKSIQQNEEERQAIPACDVSNVELLPALTFFTPPEPELNPQFKTPKSDQPVEKQFKGQLSIAALVEHVNRNAPIYSVIAEDVEYFDSIFLRDTTIPIKVLLLKPDEKIPFWWKGLTSEFKDRIEFAELDSDEPFLRKRYQLSGIYPDVLVLQYDKDKQKYKQIIYKGEKKLDNLIEFLNPYALSKKAVKETSMYYEDPSKWNRVEEVTVEQMKQALKTEEQWILLHVKTKDQSHPLFKTIKKEFKGLIKFYQITCNDQECQNKLKQQFKIKNIPQINIYPFNSKTINNALIVRNKDTTQTIAEFMLESMTAQTRTLRSLNYETLLAELKLARDQDLFPVLWFYASEDPFWGVIAATVSSMHKYNKHLKFLFYADPNEEQRQQWGIQKLPRLMTFAEVNVDTGKHKQYGYDVEQMNIATLLSYLNQCAAENEKTKVQYRSPEQVESQEKLEQLCLNTNLPCVIAFLDTIKEGKFKTDSESFTSLRVHYKEKDLNFFWIDGRCHKGVLRNFKIDKEDLSKLVVYNPVNSKYVMMEGDFALKSMVQFIDNVLNKKMKKKFKLLDDIFEIEDKNCQSLRQQLRQQYLQERERRQQLFAQAERMRDKENARIQRIREQRKILGDEDETIDNDDL